MSWDSYEKAAEKGPGSIAIRVILFIFGLSIVIGVGGWTLGLFGEAAQVAHDEFAPKAALTKYEWFINQANSIKKMDQDIGIFKKRQGSLKEQYQSYGADMGKWPPHIQAQYNKDFGQARDDLVAVTSQRNNLVREYNASSAKFNWKVFESRAEKPDQSFKELNE